MRISILESGFGRELRKYRYPMFLLFAFCMMATFSFFAMMRMQGSSAASTAGFNPGNIMSDAVMSNYNTMSVDEIQAFLNSKNKCNNTDYAGAIARYPNAKFHWKDGHFVCLREERFGEGTVYGEDLAEGEGQTAAEIIYEAAHDYQINPQVLLVLLEKEQSLLTDTYPSANQYRIATGYGCPDNAACDAKYYGFKNQIRNAANLFRIVLDGGWSNYPAYTTVKVNYSPTAACGGTNVYIENRATSALYRYTPYQPNAAALAAGYGIGDNCSAYGNRNFYLYFTDWFGSTQYVRVDGVEVTLPDGTYSFVSASESSRALSVAGVNSELALLNDSDGSMRWVVKNNGNGYYTLTNIATGKDLDTAGQQTALGNNVLVAPSSDACSRLWKIYQTMDGYFTFESGCSSGVVLESVPKEGYTNVELGFTNNIASQKWLYRTGKTLSDGIYTIATAANTNKVVDLDQHSATDGSNIQIWDKTGIITQKWRVTYVPSGDYYSIVDVLTNRPLDLQGGNIANGTNVRLLMPNNTCSQRWRITKRDDGSYTLLSGCSFMRVLDLENSVTINGNNIRIWQFDQRAVGQRWQFSTASLNSSVTEGTYILYSKLNKDYALDLANSQTYNGNNIRIWQFDQRAVGQRWSIKRDNRTGYYVLTDIATGKALDIWAGGMSPGTNISLWDAYSTCAQRWSIHETEPGYFTLFSACQADRVLDAQGAYNNANAWLWYFNNTDAQKWSLVKID